MSKVRRKIGIALELLAAAVILSFPFAIRLDCPWIGPGYGLVIVVLLVGAGVCERTPTPSPSDPEADGIPCGGRGRRIGKIGIALRLLGTALILSSPWWVLPKTPWTGFGYVLAVILLFIAIRYCDKKAIIQTQYRSGGR